MTDENHAARWIAMAVECERDAAKPKCKPADRVELLEMAADYRARATRNPYSED